MKYFKRKRLTKLDLPGRQEVPLHQEDTQRCETATWSPKRSAPNMH
jgi:hypothetical protein